MRSIRFYNAKIAQFSKDNPTFFEGELWTEDERISYVGPSVYHKDTPFAREIDCRGNLLLPGFKNAHSHIEDSEQSKTFLSTMKQQFTYEITPGGLGHCVNIKCNECGETKDITDN